jgi:hypothetical protein
MVKSAWATAALRATAVPLGEAPKPVSLSSWLIGSSKNVGSTYKAPDHDMDSDIARREEATAAATAQARGVWQVLPTLPRVFPRMRHSKLLPL